MAEVSPLSNQGMSRACAFHRLGVELTLPARSRSGVRGDDGMVVFAMLAAAVDSDMWGSFCPLWVPASGHDRAVDSELLEHCRLAVRHGVAEGFVLGDGAPFPLRVAKRGTEYWAKWGGAARTQFCGSQRQVAGARAR